MSKDKIVVRFPPSPTGFLHIGNVRTALYNYLFTKQNGGKFILRIEDTDKLRSKKEYEEDMLSGMKWLGLDFDNKDDVWRQSERTQVYKNYLSELIRVGAAYISEEIEGENREVVRFRNPGGKIKFQDLIRGEVEIEVETLKDFVIARNIDEPLYHLAVVVDDLESQVTHIIRGDDHISNTPRQILIWRAITEVSKIPSNMPVYAHLPMILAEDKSKLSKRKHGESVSLKYYKEQGYKPEAILNFLALIGWNPGTNQEIFDLEELIKCFDIHKVQKKSGIFDIKKLRWINKEYLKRQKTETEEEIRKKLAQMFPHSAIHPKLVETLFERIEVISDITKMQSEGDLDYFFKQPEIEVSKISWKNQDKDSLARILNQELKIMEENSDIEIAKEKIKTLSEQEGRGEVFWPLRFSLSGKEKSPDPLTLISILGIPESINRIKNAIAKL